MSVENKEKLYEEGTKISTSPDIPPTTIPPVPHETTVGQIQEDDPPTPAPMLVETTLTNSIMNKEPSTTAYNQRTTIDEILNLAIKTHKLFYD